MKQLIINGECLEEMKKLESGSFDLILTDPPYGTIKGLGGDIEKYKHLSNSNWDVTLDNKEVFNQCNRLLRKNGKLILFSQEPYTSKLIGDTIPNLPFCYRLIWEKDHFANCLVVNKAPVSYFEDIIVFAKSSEAIPDYDMEFIHPLREYFKDIFEFIGLTKKELIQIIGQSADHTFRFESSQFGLCTEFTYTRLIEIFKLQDMNGFKHYSKLKEINQIFKNKRKDDRLKYLEEHNNKFPSIFNLWEGNKLKSNILKYKKDYSGFHPTQKPVELLKDLIKTYSNDGDKILDFTAGSFSTLVACKETNRKGVGIELEEKYCEIGTKRLSEVQETLE